MSLLNGCHGTGSQKRLQGQEGFARVSETLSQLQCSSGVNTCWARSGIRQCLVCACRQGMFAVACGVTCVLAAVVRVPLCSFECSCSSACSAVGRHSSTVPPLRAFGCGWICWSCPRGLAGFLFGFLGGTVGCVCTRVHAHGHETYRQCQSCIRHHDGAFLVWDPPTTFCLCGCKP